MTRWNKEIERELRGVNRCLERMEAEISSLRELASQTTPVNPHNLSATEAAAQPCGVLWPPAPLLGGPRDGDFVADNGQRREETSQGYYWRRTIMLGGGRPCVVFVWMGQEDTPCPT